MINDYRGQMQFSPSRKPISLLLNKKKVFILNVRGVSSKLPSRTA